jgi:hypothetical protein
MKKGNVKPPDFRVWNKDNKSKAASRWADQETMHKAIGDVIHKNIDTIRKVTAGGGDVVLERQAVGYKTGEGFVRIPGEEGKVYRDANLDGVTIVIKPRKNHVPTDDDPEGWYVHTAFPEVGE